MKYGTVLTRGDLVTWEEWAGVSKSGVVLDIIPSNVYEPEECEVLCEGETRFVRSKCLKLVVPTSEKEF